MQKPNKIKALDPNRYLSILNSPGQVQALATRLNLPNPKAYKLPGDLYKILDGSQRPEAGALLNILRECIEGQHYAIKMCSDILADMAAGWMPRQAPLKGRGAVRFPFSGDPECIPTDHITTLTTREDGGFRTCYVISQEVRELFKTLYAELHRHHKLFENYHTPAEMAREIPQAVQVAGHGR